MAEKETDIPILNYLSSEKVLQLLSVLKNTPAGMIIYQQVERILLDTTYTQGRITRGYAALLQTLLGTLRKQLPRDSLLYLELKLVQQRLYPPISLSELSTLQVYIKKVTKLLSDCDAIDEELMRDALRPLFDNGEATSRVRPTEQTTEVPVQQQTTESKIEPYPPSIDLSAEGKSFDKVENHPEPSDQSIQMENSEFEIDPPSVGQRVLSVQQHKLDKQRRGFKELQSSLTDKVEETTLHHKEFGSLLEVVLDDLRADTAVNDADALRNRVIKEVHKLLNAHELMAGTLEETKGYLHLVGSNSQKLTQELDQVRVLSLTDDLTDLPNRRAFLRTLEDEIGRAERYGAPLTLVILDLDYFKDINDKYGHTVGDQILRIYAREILSVFRRHDMVSRYGGEEFAVLLSNTDIDGALRSLIKVRNKAAKTYYTYHNATLNVPTFSAGVALYKQGETMDHLIERADAVLYKAKQLGRNRIEIDESSYDVQKNAISSEHMSSNNISSGHTSSNNISTEQWNQLKEHLENST